MSQQQERSYYKILGADGRSLHGGNMRYSLPIQQPDGTWTPGDWHEVTGPLKLCYHGLHLTDQPALWWRDGARCYATEYQRPGERCEVEHKIVVGRCRLLRPLTTAELAKLGVYLEGEHVVHAGSVAASGSATVKASGSATVRASDSVTVRAYGSATVVAHGSATVRASGSATVRAYDSATVVASGSASVRASDSATVEASDSVTVRAYGSATVRASDSVTVEAPDSVTVRAYGSVTVRAYGDATVRAYGDATVTSIGGSPTVILHERAVHIDRRNGRPVVSLAEDAR